MNLTQNTHRRVLPLLLLFSGFSGIAYEVLYGRLIGNLIGDQFAVSAAVLITFLLGTGLGSILSIRMKIPLWAIELCIGILGIFYALNYGWIEGVFYENHSDFFNGIHGKIWIASFFLFGPALLIGFSVPLFAHYLKSTKKGTSFAKVYSIYNLGAAVTVIVLEFFIFRKLGLKGALLFFSSVNLITAFLLKFALPKPPESMETLILRNSFSNPLPIIALILASVSSAVFQLYMIKLSELMFGPFRETFALVLAIVIFGITLGSYLVNRFKIDFLKIMTLNLVGILLILFQVQPILSFYAKNYSLASQSHIALLIFKFSILVFLMLIPSITFGATIPAFTQNSQPDSQKNVPKQPGFLLLMSSLGNCLGFLLMVFVFHQYLDYGTQLIVVGALSLSAIWIYSRFDQQQISVGIIFLFVTAGVHHFLWDEDTLYLSYTAFHSKKEMVESRATFKKASTFKGYQDVFSLTWLNGDPHFFINGYISFPLNSSSEKIVGLLSVMFSPKTDEALVLGLGSGSTASVVGLAFDHTDAIEINPAVRANLYQMKEWNFDIEHNPKVNIVVDDAIHFTRTSPKKYSLILNTVTSPLYFSSSKLYTADFFKTVKSRLTPEGVYVTWIDSRIGDRGFDIILKTLNTQFRECGMTYIKSAYFLLICGDAEISLKQTGLAKRAPEVWEELLKDYRILPEHLPNRLLTSHAFQLIGDERTAVNSLDLPSLEFEMANLTSRGFPGAKSRIERQMNFQEIARALKSIQNWRSIDLAVEAKHAVDDSFIERRWETLNQVKQAPALRLYNEADLHYYAEIAKRAKTAKAFHKYGYQLMERNRYKEAISQFNWALSINSRHDNSNFNIGSCYEYLGDLKRAEEYYRRELAIDPSDDGVPRRLERLKAKKTRKHKT